MPNWCSNREIIVGPKDEIHSLLNKLDEWTSKNYMENDFGTGWLGNIVLGAGFNIYDDDPKNGFSCRGSLNDNFEIEDFPNESRITFGSLTAWAPMPEMWYAIIKKYAPHCKYYYASEEPGNEVYETNDAEGKFFPETIFVDVFYNDEENAPEVIKKHFPESSYEYSMTDVITGLKAILNSDKDSFDTLIKEYYEKEKSITNETVWLRINKVKIVPEK